jgi:hypothetical protein
MFENRPRLANEYRTIEVMVGIYCRDYHGRRRGLCLDCAALLAYAGRRLDRCPFQEDKPVCADCLVHCYKPELREKVRVMMRYAGPRMLFRHPILAIRHLIAGWGHPPRELKDRKR